MPPAEEKNVRSETSNAGRAVFGSLTNKRQTMMTTSHRATVAPGYVSLMSGDASKDFD